MFALKLRPADVDPTAGAWRPLVGLALVVTLVTAALTATPDVLGASDAIRTTGEWADWLYALSQASWLVACLGAVLLAEWRPWLGLGLAVATGVTTLLLASSVPVTVFVVVGGVVVVAVWRSVRAATAAAVAGMALAAAWAATGRAMALPMNAETGTGAGDERWTTAVLVATTLLTLLLVVRSQRSQQRLWLDRTLLASREERVAEREGVVQERARLSRDLHDVVAHHVSLIAVRAETAPYSHPDLGPAARTVLADVATDARLALDELRGVLGLLGRAEEGPRAPQPTWSDVPALVERSRAAGAVVELTGDVGGAVPPSVGYVAYRVVQEALTNARRHAPGLPVAVALDADADGAAVTIRNPHVGQASRRGAGRGLAGMRERVEGLGGRLAVGPRDDEFVVEAVFGSRA